MIRFMADTENMFEATDANFAAEVEAGRGLHVIDFWAAWCGPCRLVAPVVEQLAAEYSDRGVTVGKLDVDANQKTASRFNVLSIPSILFFKEGELVDRIVGAVPKKTIEDRINQHL